MVMLDVRRAGQVGGRDAQQRPAGTPARAATGTVATSSASKPVAPSTLGGSAAWRSARHSSGLATRWSPRVPTTRPAPRSAGPAQAGVGPSAALPAASRAGIGPSGPVAGRPAVRLRSASATPVELAQGQVRVGGARQRSSSSAAPRRPGGCCHRSHSRSLPARHGRRPGRRSHAVVGRSRSLSAPAGRALVTVDHASGPAAAGPRPSRLGASGSVPRATGGEAARRTAARPPRRRP